VKYKILAISAIMIMVSNFNYCSNQPIIIARGGVLECFPARQAITLQSGQYKIQTNISFRNTVEQTAKINDLQQSFAVLISKYSVDQVNAFIHMYRSEDGSITCKRRDDSIARFFPDGSEKN
jgi:hypothetical protein